MSSIIRSMARHQARHGGVPSAVVLSTALPWTDIPNEETDQPSRHCEKYIDDETKPACLRRFLDYSCRPASLKYPTGNEDFDRGLEGHLGMSMWRDPVPELYADYRGFRVSVTMASRFGDVGITPDADAEHGYSTRVGLEKLSNFSDRWDPAPCGQG